METPKLAKLIKFSIVYGLVCGLIYGVVLGIPVTLLGRCLFQKNIVENNNLSMISLVVLFCLLAGVLIGVTFKYTRNTILKKVWNMMGEGLMPIATSARQEKEFALAISQDNAPSRAKEALAQLGAKINNIDEERGLIIAKTAASWTGWGEILTITFKSDNENYTQIKIESKSVLKTQKFDLSEKNLDNVKRFHDLMVK